MEVAQFAEEEQAPLHLEKLSRMASALESRKQQSDAVTWTAELLPHLVETAVKTVLVTEDRECVVLPVSEPAQASQIQSKFAPCAIGHLLLTSTCSLAGPSCCITATRPHLSCSLTFYPSHAGQNLQFVSDASVCQDAEQLSTSQAQFEITEQQPELTPSATEIVVISGSQHWRSNSSSRGLVDWVVTTCLVPDGLPTAVEAEAGGGLAAIEVVCRVLVLQDCQPAAVSAGLLKALKAGMSLVHSPDAGLPHIPGMCCAACTCPPKRPKLLRCQ